MPQQDSKEATVLLVIVFIILALLFLSYAILPSIVEFTSRRKIIIVRVSDSSDHTKMQYADNSINTCDDEGSHRILNRHSRNGDNILGKEMQLSDYSEEIMSLTWSPKGDRLAFGCLFSNTITIYNTSSWKVVKTLQDIPKGVRSIEWSPDETKLAAGFQNDEVYIWNVENWNFIINITGYYVSWSPDNMRLATGNGDSSNNITNQTVLIWDCNSWDNLKTLPVPVENISGGAWTDGIHCVKWSPDNNLLSCGLRDGKIVIWETGDWTQLKVIYAHGNYARRLSWSLNSSYLASVSTDDKVNIWSKEKNWSQVQTLTVNGQTLCVSWNGLFLATGGGNNVYIFNSSEWNNLQIIHVGGGQIFSVAFNPNKYQLAIGTEDGLVEIWSIGSVRDGDEVLDVYDFFPDDPTRWEKEDIKDKKIFTILIACTIILISVFVLIIGLLIIVHKSRVKDIWYLPSENTWKEFNFFAMRDSGVLNISDKSLEFNGKSTKLKIHNIKSVSYGKQGRDYVNNWVKVEYLDNKGQNTQAYFADGGLLGWAGFFGGTKKIFKLIKQLEEN